MTTLPKIEQIEWSEKRCHCGSLTLRIEYGMNSQVICLHLPEKKVVWHGAFGGYLSSPEWSTYPTEDGMIKGIREFVLNVMKHVDSRSP